MKIALCTLFNSLYLDKGLVLYNSLKECSKDFELYVLCMDDKCHEVLTKENLPHIIPIKLEDFENEDLLRVKKERRLGEYFWTCSSWLISYVLTTYRLDYCTYVDADMYFYSDPAVLIEEMESKKATVLVVGHRFHPLLAKEKANKVGKYCVEFNTFKNEDRALRLLDKWKAQVLEHCSLDGDGVHWGDQKYLDDWENLDFVVETENMGAGVAPWNISQYKLDSSNDNKIQLRTVSGRTDLIFYHFENIQYIDDHTINNNIECYRGIDQKLIMQLYPNYLSKIAIVKKYLKDFYGIDFMLKSHPGVGDAKKHSMMASAVNMVHRLVNVMKGIMLLPFRLSVIVNCSLPSRMFKKYQIVNF